MTPGVDLVAEITRRIPLPIDALEITAVLESLGITDELARRRYDVADVFDLADKVLANARMSTPGAVSGPDAETTRTGRATVKPRRRSPTRPWAFGTAFAVALVGLALQTFGAPLSVPASGVGEEPAPQPITSFSTPPPDTTPAPTREHDAPAAESPTLVPLPKVDNGNMVARAVQPRSRVILDERFDDYSRGWPDDPSGTAWLTRDGYRLSPREPGRFVAVGAQLGRPARDVIVTATFRKVGGPPGGGYGVIVRDQGPGPRDGLSQGGRYYVLEAGDVGDVGIWLREHDRWVDLVPWQRSSLGRLDGERNEVQAQALGPRLTLLVNGTAVATVSDATVGAGDVGIFVGGDGNEVVLEHLLIVLPAQ
jgi:hypothetical protein